MFRKAELSIRTGKKAKEDQKNIESSLGSDVMDLSLRGKAEAGEWEGC